jgi:hypothetical protein
MYKLTIVAMVALAALAIGAVDLQVQTDLDWTYNCTDSSHLFKNATLYLPTEMYEVNQTIYCEYGCSSDMWGHVRCNAPTFQRHIFIILLAVLVLLFAIYLLKKL